MARIETYRTRDSFADADFDLEFKFLHNTKSISHEDVKKYADLVAADFTVKDLEAEEVAVNNDERQKIEMYVVDALSDEKIINAFCSNEAADDLVRFKKKVATDSDIIAGINKIRQALIKELQSRISKDIYIVTKDYRRLYKSLDDVAGIVGVAYRLKTGKEFVYKEPAFFDETTKQGFLSAQEIYQKLEMPPDIRRHFRDFVEYDAMHNVGILEKRNFVPLNKYLNEESIKLDKTSVLVSLRSIRDCLVAANYLAENGLVLQDIGPHNIGIEEVDEKNKQGLLFDLEGLVLEKQNILGRIGIGNSFDLELMLDHTDEYKGSTSPAEMVYGFGKSLGAINAALDKKGLVKKPAGRTSLGKKMESYAKSDNQYEVLYKNLSDLATKMTRQQAQHKLSEDRRINLAAAIKDLGQIISQFEKSAI